MCVCVFSDADTCQGTHVKDKGQFAGVGSVLPPCEILVLNPDHQASTQLLYWSQEVHTAIPNLRE